MACTEKQKAATKAWKVANPDKVKAYNKKYNGEHAVEIKAYSLKYRLKYRDRINKRKREHHVLHREEINSKERLRYHNEFLIEGEREKKRGCRNGYYAVNAEKLKSVQRLRNLLTLEKYEQAFTDNTKQFGKLTCYLCLKYCKRSDANLEHKIPYCKLKHFPDLDFHSPKNMNVAHTWCNLIKGRRLLCECSKDEFVKPKSFADTKGRRQSLKGRGKWKKS